MNSSSPTSTTHTNNNAVNQTSSQLQEGNLKERIVKAFHDKWHPSGPLNPDTQKHFSYLVDFLPRLDLSKDSGISLISQGDLEKLEPTFIGSYGINSSVSGDKPPFYVVIKIIKKNDLGSFFYLCLEQDPNGATVLKIERMGREIEEPKLNSGIIEGVDKMHVLTLMILGLHNAYEFPVGKSINASRRMDALIAKLFDKSQKEAHDIASKLQLLSKLKERDVQFKIGFDKWFFSLQFLESYEDPTGQYGQLKGDRDSFYILFKLRSRNSPLESQPLFLTIEKFTDNGTVPMNVGFFGSFDGCPEFFASDYAPRGHAARQIINGEHPQYELALINTPEQSIQAHRFDGSLQLAQNLIAQVTALSKELGIQPPSWPLDAAAVAAAKEAFIRAHVPSNEESKSNHSSSSK